jgi:hypothetical protein
VSEGEYQASLVDPEPWDDEDAIYESSAHHPLFDEEPSDVGIGFWRTGSREVLRISEMTDRHLRNAIDFSERFDIADAGKINELRAELAKR